MKKEKLNYFDEFISSVALAKEAAEKLKDFIFNFNELNVEETTKLVHEIENKADGNLHKIINFLLKDFLPPIDREDVMAIAHKIDDVVDGIDEIMININIYRIDKIDEHTKNMIELLVKCVNNTFELSKKFKNIKNINEIKEKIIEINSIEEQADRLYEDAIKTLFIENCDGVVIIKYSKLYESIENCFDYCENVADSIEEVLMKNN